jgi:hypothetical protein
MSIIDLILSRRSIRRYEKKDIPKELAFFPLIKQKLMFENCFHFLHMFVSIGIDFV